MRKEIRVHKRISQINSFFIIFYIMKMDPPIENLFSFLKDTKIINPTISKILIPDTDVRGFLETQQSKIITMHL
jgi:hypothetical protein